MERQSPFERSLPADDEEPFDGMAIELAKPALDTLLRSKLGAPRCAKNRSTDTLDPIDIIGGERANLSAQQSLIAVEDGHHFEAEMPRHAMRGTHRSVHSGSVSTTGHDADPSQSHSVLPSCLAYTRSTLYNCPCTLASARGGEDEQQYGPARPYGDDPQARGRVHAASRSGKH